MVDRNKRKTLRAIGVTSIGATAALSAPGVFAAAHHTLGKSNSESREPLSGITVTHYDNFYGHTVLLKNETKRAVTLGQFASSHVATPAGGFDLNRLFASGELIIPANSTQAFSITHKGKAERHALWTNTNRSSEFAKLGSGTHSASVIGQRGSMSRVRASRTYVATMNIA